MKYKYTYLGGDKANRNDNLYRCFIYQGIAYYDMWVSKISSYLSEPFLSTYAHQGYPVSKETFYLFESFTRKYKA